MIHLPSDALRAQLQSLFGADLVIDRELGRGGMAAVFVAHDPALERQVAVKMLLPHFADDQAVADRFLREGRTMASLEHPNVVTVYSVRGRGSTNAIVMQFVDGPSLEQLLERQPSMPLTEAGSLLAQVAAGLQHAHERGVVHRDVKPANVLVDSAGRARVSDFGIARRDDGLDVTKTGIVLGTSDYMSPEQRSGERVTPATDQYAMGVMVYEVLCRRMPFVGTPMDVIRGHMSEDPPSLREFRREIPAHIDAVVARMMAKSPADRWPTMEPVVEAFQSLEPIRRPSATDRASHAAITASGTKTRRMALLAATVLVVGGGSAWWFVRSPNAAGAITNASGSVVPSTISPPAVVKDSAPSRAVDNALRDMTGTNSASTRDATTRRPEVETKSITSVPPSASPTTARALPLANQATQSSVPSSALPTAPSTVRSDSLAISTPTASTPSAPAAVTSDARAIGRQMVTLLNQRRTRELSLLTPIGGDEAARAELLRLVDRAADFAVGFDRLPSAPSAWTSGFQTDAYLDVEWRGGKKIVHVTLYATHFDDGWHLVGFSVESSSLLLDL